MVVGHCMQRILQLNRQYHQARPLLRRAVHLLMLATQTSPCNAQPGATDSEMYTQVKPERLLASACKRLNSAECSTSQQACAMRIQVYTANLYSDAMPSHCINNVEMPKICQKYLMFYTHMYDNDTAYLYCQFMAGPHAQKTPSDSIGAVLGSAPRSPGTWLPGGAGGRRVPAWQPRCPPPGPAPRHAAQPAACPAPATCAGGRSASHLARAAVQVSYLTFYCHFSFLSVTPD